MSEESLLFVGSFEHTVTHLGGGADPLDLHTTFVSEWEESFTEDDGSLLWTWAVTSDHDEVTLDHTIVDPSTEWVDTLVGSIHLSSADSGVSGGTNEEDEFVLSSTVEIAHLTGTSDGVVDISWVPAADTSDLTGTTSSLTWEEADVPTGCATFETTTAGDGDGVNLLTFFEDGGNFDFLFEHGSGEVNLLGDVTTVNLDFDDLGLLGFKWGLVWLGVSDEADNTAFLLDLGELVLEFFWVLSSSGFVLGESVLLGVLSLVESALGGFSDVSSPDGVSGLDTLWSLDITDDTGTNHGWGIEDGDLLDDLLHGLLVGGTFFDETHDVGVTSLVADETSEVAGLGSVILWEGLDLWAGVGATLLW